MFDAWVKVFLIFMGGPLFMMFGGLAVLLWGTWLAHEGEEREQIEIQNGRMWKQLL